MYSFKDFLKEAVKVYSDNQAHQMFMYGHCRSFAHALHNKIGGEIRALHRKGKEFHVYVHKDGKNYDHKGQRGNYAMIRDMTGGESAHEFSEHPVDHTKMKINSKMVDNANKYIDANKHKFGLK